MRRDLMTGPAGLLQGRLLDGQGCGLRSLRPYGPNLNPNPKSNTKYYKDRSSPLTPPGIIKPVAFALNSVTNVASFRSSMLVLFVVLCRRVSWCPLAGLRLYSQCANPNPDPSPNLSPSLKPNLNPNPSPNAGAGTHEATGEGCGLACGIHPP